MTETEDRSYYEISLTNGQVLVAFTVLLACVLGAFVSGMWVAREALGEGAERTSAGPRVEGEPAETLEFFGDEGARDGRTPPSSANVPEGASSEPEPPAPRIQQVKPLPASTEAPKREASSREASSPERATGATEVAEAESTSPPPVVATRDPDRREPTAASVADRDRREATPTASTPTTSTQAARADGFVIQVFSSSDEAQAEALVQRLRGGGYRAYQASESVDGRTVYRVRVGPYPDRTGAQREAEKLKREFKLDTWVTASG